VHKLLEPALLPFKTNRAQTLDIAIFRSGIDSASRAEGLMELSSYVVR